LVQQRRRAAGTSRTFWTCSRRFLSYIWSVRTSRVIDSYCRYRYCIQSSVVDPDLYYEIAKIKLCGHFTGGGKVRRIDKKVRVFLLFFDERRHGPPNMKYRIKYKLLFNFLITSLNWRNERYRYLFAKHYPVPNLLLALAWLQQK